MGLLILTFQFLFGLTIGSFLNAFEYRLGKKQYSLKQRSFCPKCKHKLAPLDLIPLLSYLFLRGKCRYCKKGISIQYPIIEFLTGYLFVFSGLYFLQFFDIYSLENLFGYFIFTFIISCFLSVFVFLGLYDAKHEIVPDKITIPTIFALIALVLTSLGFTLADINLWERLVDCLKLENIDSFSFVFLNDPVGSLMAGLIGGLFFIAIILVSKGKGMGGGDIRLGILMGLLLGLEGLFVALYVAFILGAIVGVAYALRKKKLKGLIIPFAPFLCFGSLVSFFFQEKIWELIFPSFGY